MTSKELEHVLIEAVCEWGTRNDVDVVVATFEESGLATRDNGVTIRFPKDKSAFQLTIARTSGAD